MANESLNLPPGFHFSPTDEELIAHFLYPKASLSPNCHSNLIPDLDLLSINPWDLQGKALSSENKWYFFSQVKEKRETDIGYWKLLDAEESLAITSGNKRVGGVKKCFVFCTGDQSTAEDSATETNWLMQEYHLINNNRSASSSSCKRKGNKKLDCKSWVLCRVHERKDHLRWDSNNNESYDDGIELSCLDEVFLSFDDDLDEVSLPNY